METVKIFFNGTTDTDFKSGVIQSISWDSLLPTISDFVKLRPYEQISGLEINDTEVRVKISQKKGRKKLNGLHHPIQTLMGHFKPDAE